MDWFASLGSKDIYTLEYRCAFAFISINGQSAREHVAYYTDDQVSID